MTKFLKFANKITITFILIMLVNLKVLVVYSTNSSSNDLSPSLHSEQILLFNESNAINHISSQLDIGFRVPGTPEHDMCADWIRN
ncbi:MAG: hypothetical protein H7647_09360, partial [Candidatus Heimdallarchaeota archaeon]|nr:hypothetical protein [Candidatus Heimdallarchaeota archaeon]MCK4254635.1 hypothetical protein [Candidatus Heimdallarchaeota archaeon]